MGNCLTAAKNFAWVVWPGFSRTSSRKTRPQARPGIKREKKDGAERGGGIGGVRMKMCQQRHGDERPKNGSHRVTGALKPERLAARFRRDRSRQDGVARRAANSPPEPSQGARKQNQRPAGGQGNERGGTSGDEIAAHRNRLAAPGAVGKPSGSQLDETRNAVRHSLDEAQRGGGNSQGREEAGQHRRGHLMADVGKHAGQPHAHDVSVEPGGRGSRVCPVHTKHSSTIHGALGSAELSRPAGLLCGSFIEIKSRRVQEQLCTSSFVAPASCRP